MESLVVHLKDRDVEYGHSGNGIGEILQLLAADLFECWNEIDESDIGVCPELRRYRAAHPKAAKSR